jgi:cytochrome c
LFGRKAGSIPGYAYSKTLKTSDIIWNAKTISKLFELGPKYYTPGTKMPLQRIRSVKQRAALIAFLKRSTGGPTQKTR